MGNVVHVSIEKAAGSNMVTVSEWLAVAFVERVDLLKEGKVTFLDDLGDEVPAMEALKQMQGR